MASRMYSINKGAGDVTNRGHAQGSGKGWRPWKPESTVAVSGVKERTKKTSLQEAFGDFGRIIRIEAPGGSAGVGWGEVPEGKQVAFVEFEERRDASEAILEMNNRSFEGRRIGVRMVEDLPNKERRGRDSSPKRVAPGGHRPESRRRSRSQDRRPGARNEAERAKSMTIHAKTCENHLKLRV